MINYTFGILPTIMRHDARVSDFACRLYSEVDSLSNKYGYCFATNATLAKNLQKSRSQISRTLSELEGLGYVSLVVEDGYKRKIYPKRDFRDMEGVDENAEGGTQKRSGGVRNFAEGGTQKQHDCNKIIELDKLNKKKEKELVECNSTPLLGQDEIEEIEQQIYASKQTQKKEKKISAKRKEKVDDPAPITPMWQEYEKRFADLNQGEAPVFHKKYLRPLKTLFVVLRERTIKKGIIPLNDLQPWCDFLDMAVQYLKNNPKETYLRGRFDPMGIESEFNKWITTLNNRPKTEAERWMEFAQRNGVL